MGGDGVKDSGKTFRWMAFLLLVLWLVLHTVWRLLDHTPPRGDQVTYSIGALNILRVWPLSWIEFYRALNDVTHTSRPPGGSLFLSPWFALFDGDLNKINTITVLWHAASFGVIYLLGKRFFNRETGLLAALFFVSLRVIYNFEIHPELYFMTLTPLAILICSHLWDEKRSRWLWWLAMGIVTAVGLLCKWIFLIYLLGPMLLMVVDLIRRARRDGDIRWFFRSGVEIALMLVPVALVAFFWYWPNRVELTSAFATIAQERQFTPFNTGWTWQVPFFYPIDFFKLNKFIPSFFALIGLCVALNQILFNSKALSLKERNGYSLILSSLGGFWIYTTIGYQNIPNKYLYPLLPLIALVAVRWISLIPWRNARRVCQAVILGYALFCAFWIHFALRSWVVESGPSVLPQKGWIDPDRALLYHTVPMSWPPHTQAFPQEAIAETIAELEEDDSAPGRITILPNIYHFLWRNNRVALKTQLPNFETQPVSHPGLGLMRLYQSRYLLTGRARVLHETYSNLDPANRLTLLLNRYIERAPDWFWSHYRLVKRFHIPYTHSELQLYRLERPHDRESTAALCNLWIAEHLGEPEAWAQIKNIWGGRRDGELAQRAKAIEAVLRDKNETDAISLIERYHHVPNLYPYERMEMGALALEYDRAEIGIEWLKNSSENESACAWRTAILLGEWFERQNEMETAKDYYLRSWRLQRERPEALQKLEALALTTGDHDGRNFYNRLIDSTIQILNQNRHPIHYRNAAEILLQNDRTEDALWFAQQDFLVGRNKTASVIQYHEAQQRLGLNIPDYQSIPLPNQPVSLKTGGVHVFPFLNLKEGVYRLSWKHRIEASPLHLSYSIDDATAEFQTYDSRNQADGGMYVFDSSAWRDRLRIDCQSGEAELWDFVLQKIRMDLPLIDRDKNILVKRRWTQHERIEPDGGFSFDIEDDRLQLDFPVETDPRAWDTIEIRSRGLASRSSGAIASATFTLFVRGNGVSEKPIVFHQAIRDGVSRIRFPDEAKAYPFQTGMRVFAENLKPGIRRRLERVTFIRK